MRIGIEAQRIFRKKKHGMDIYALELIRHLQQIDKINKYFVFVNPGEDSNCLHETQNFKIVTQEGVYPVWEQYYLPKLTRKYNLDLLHSTSNTTPIFINIPLVVTLHDIIFLDNSLLLNSNFTVYQYFGNIYRNIIVSILLRKQINWITVSNSEKEEISKKIKHTQSSIKVIYNGLSNSFKKNNNATELKNVAEKYKLPKNFILNIGNTDPKKNTEKSIASTALYKKETNSDIKIVIIDYDILGIEKILEKHDAIHLINDYICIGYVDNADMSTIFSLANMLLFTSVRESFGIPVIEAMSCECPVVVSNISCLIEISDGSTCVVNQHSINDIKIGIKKVLENKEYRNELIFKGIAKAKEFSWTNCATETLSKYEEVISPDTNKHSYKSPVKNLN
ncbi:MAG: glycosyltransferase family 4 protein [Ichthyobacteriaceae bacterium]|nr:glycosyltransferase family 4 protein [Ichthyobacteriaceae bacterium]